MAGLPALQAPRAPGRRSRRWVSLPFTDSLAPLTATTAEEDGLGALIEAWRVGHGIDRVEFRGPIVGAHPAPVTAYTHRLGLDPDFACVEKRFAASVRRNIRASEKRGVEVVRIASEQDFMAAYWPLHVGRAGD